MTTEELKKKIDGLFLGLHSTNPGDINAVKDILREMSALVPSLKGEPLFISTTAPRLIAQYDELASIQQALAILIGGAAYPRVSVFDKSWYSELKNNVEQTTGVSDTRVVAFFGTYEVVNGELDGADGAVLVIGTKDGESTYALALAQY